MSRETRRSLKQKCLPSASRDLDVVRTTAKEEEEEKGEEEEEVEEMSKRAGWKRVRDKMNYFQYVFKCVGHKPYVVMIFNARAVIIAYFMAGFDKNSNCSTSHLLPREARMEAVVKAMMDTIVQNLTLY